MKYLTLIIFVITLVNSHGQKNEARSKSGSLNTKINIEASNSNVHKDFSSGTIQEFNVLNLDIAKKIPKASKTNEYGIAVVIGNKEYTNPNVPNVDYAINDSRIIKQYLVDSFGYKPENIISLENASQAEMNLTFGTASNYKGRLYDYTIPNNSELFIYYSGHGAPNTDDNKAYLVPSDCDPDKVALNGYSLEILYNNLDKLAKEKNIKHVTLVLDACFSGNSQKGNLLTNISPIEIKVKSNSLLFQNKTIFTSTSENQVSTWYEDKKMSLFTYFFLKGLNGEADLNKDKIVTAEELSNYTSDESKGVPYWSRRLNSRTQIPKLQGDKDYNLLKY